MWCSGLSSLNGKPRCTMQEWLSTANFAPGAAGVAVELSGVERSHLLRALAGDINRVAVAASESLRNIVSIANIPKSLGWPYVKLYYGALFYAHCLLRLWGRSPSYIRTSDWIRVRAAFNAYGVQPPFPLQTGQFVLSADPQNAIVHITADKNGGGTHEAIWREFAAALSEFYDRVETGPYVSKDKERLKSQLVLARDLLTNKGAHLSWPSQIRNDIHYRQGEGLWYPYSGRRKSAEFALTVSQYLDGNADPSVMLGQTGDNLNRFHAACAFVIILAREVITDLANVSGPKSFLHFGQIQFEDAIRKVVQP